MENPSTSPGAGCVFCKIVAREIPADIVYESEDTLAFLDIHPTAPGHTLVIPKKHVESIFDTDDATLDATINAAREISPAVRDAVGAHGLHINSNHGAAAGQIIFHLHFHLIPRHERGEFEFWGHGDLASADAAAIGAAIREKLM